jgi:hypothetical protein
VEEEGYDEEHDLGDNEEEMSGQYSQQFSQQ